MAKEGLNLSLEIQESGREPRKESFQKDSVTIGAGSSADLKVTGEKVSDVHAMFDMSRGKEVFVMDLGSITGTFVNGKKVNKQKLEIGDEIKVGDVAIKVSAIGEKPAEKIVPVAEAIPPELEVEVEEIEAEETKVEAEKVKAEEKQDKAADKKVVEEKPVKKEAAKEKAGKAEVAEEKVEAAAEEGLEEVSEDEKKAIAEKQALLDELKRRKATRRMKYTLELFPKEHKDPGKKRVLEIREILWDNTLLSMRHLYKSSPVTVGESKACDYFVSGDFLPDKKFKLISPKGKGFELNFTDKMEGSVEPNGSSLSLAEVIKKNKAHSNGSFYSMDIEPGTACWVKFAEVKYYFRWVEKETLKPVPITKSIDYPMTSLGVVALLIYVLGLIWIKSLPAPEVADILDAPDRFAKLILEEVEMEEPPELEEEKPTEIASEEKSIGEEGKIGEEESEIDKTEGDARKRLEDQKVAESSGILGALDKGMENMDRLFGGGGLGAGLDDNLGMLEGISGLDMRGAGGLGSRGSGLGGGGTALGIGGLGTKGRGGGRGKGRYGIGAGGKLKKGSHNINIKTGNPSIKGALDKSIIARIIRKHHSQIRYCYQKELNKNPKLYGKITVKFTISPTGTVASSVVQVSTMKNFAVEQCVARTLKRIIFPRPKGGGIVVVTYPFIFKSEGS